VRVTESGLDGDVARTFETACRQQALRGDWKTGRLGDWETGRLGDWETGRLGDWEKFEAGPGKVKHHKRKNRIRHKA
jgi:hypothetical protein